MRALRRAVTRLSQQYEQLRRSEEAYRALFEQAGVGKFQIDPSTNRFVRVNRKLCEITGYDEAELLQMTPADLAHPDYRAVVTAAFGELASGERDSYEAERPYLHKSGHVVWGQVCINTVRNPNGSLETIVGIAYDVTEQHAAAEDKVRCAERYRTFIHESSEGIWRIESDAPIDTHLPIEEQIDAMFRLTYIAECNDAMARMYGRERAAELEGVRLSDILIRNESNTAYLRAFIESDYRYRGGESHERDCEGNDKYFLNNLFGIVENGRLMRAWGTQLDITELRMIQDERQRTLAQLQTVISTVDQGIVTADPRQNILDMNPAARAMFGFGNNERFPIGPDAIHDYIRCLDLAGRPIDRGDWLVTRVLRGDVLHGIEIQIEQLATGKRWIAEVGGRPVRDANGDVVLAVLTVADITQRKMTEQELEERVRQRTAEAERRAELLRRMALELSQAEQRERRRLSQLLHDHLQQLMVAAKMQVSALRRQQEPERVRRSAQRVEDLLAEAINSSRSLTVELSPPVLYDANLVTALQWLARQMEVKHHLHVDVQGKLEDATLEEDVRVLLFHAVRELLFNIVKHAGVDEASVRVESHDGDIHVVVEDRGQGFPPEMTAGKLGTAERFGLFSIQERVELVGGSMTIDSRPGEGATVHLVVPRALSGPLPTPTSPTPEAARRSGSAPAWPGRIRVLIADDHKLIRDGIATILASQPDIELVGEASDGVMAVELAERLRPNVVIMDITMPRMSGIEATRRIAATVPTTRVVGLSMHDQGEMADAMRDAGAWGYLTKGAPAEDVMSAIRSASVAPTP